MDAAEAVFVADSHAVAAGLRHVPAATIHPTALAAISMVDIVSGFLGYEEAMAWLARRPASPGTAVDRNVANQAVRLAHPDAVQETVCSREVAHAWQTRNATLAAYRRRLPTDADVDLVIESLLHMHHNRALGIDQDRERTCRRLARQAALAWQARQLEIRA
jgi:thiopeptide-type bacteriocin biosynthesis protein